MPKHRLNEEQFPALFDDGKIRVYKNPCNEIFVQNVATGATMRINSDRQGLTFTAFSHSVQPVVVAGSIGYAIR